MIRPALWLAALLGLTGLAWAQTTPSYTQVKIMYFTPADEMKLSQGVRALDLPLPVLRIGVADSSGRKLALIRFLATGGSRAQCRREAVRIARMSFKTLPDLFQVDLTGDDRDDEHGQKKRPGVLFSCSLRRGTLQGVPASALPGRQLEGAGMVHFAAELAPDPDTVGAVEAFLRQSFQSGFRRMPIHRAQRNSTPSP